MHMPEGKQNCGKCNVQSEKNPKMQDARCRFDAVFMMMSSKRGVKYFQYFTPKCTIDGQYHIFASYDDGLYPTYIKEICITFCEAVMLSVKRMFKNCV